MPPAPIYDLALGRCPVWLQQARALWLSHPLFFLAVSAGVVLLRRGLDAWGMDIFIVVSYLTDAWIFTWLCLGVARGGGGKSWAVSRAGWQAVRGERPEHQPLAQPIGRVHRLGPAEPRRLGCSG